MENPGIAQKRGVMDVIKNWIAHNKQVWLTLYVPAYLIAFCLLQARQVPVRTVHFAFDYRIPFCEYFIIPYCAWYFLLIGVGLYKVYAVHDDRLYRLYARVLGIPDSSGSPPRGVSEG